MNVHKAIPAVILAVLFFLTWYLLQDMGKSDSPKVLIREKPRSSKLKQPTLHVSRAPSAKNEPTPKATSLSKKMDELIAKPLQRVMKLASDFEIKRSQFKRIQLPNGQEIVQAVISPGNQDEIRIYREAVASEIAKLPEDAQPYFLVDAQRWQDQVLNPNAKARVLYLQRTIAETGGERVYYWDFETSDPSQFGLDSSGQIQVPNGQTVGPGRKWFGSAYKPPLRYSHLFQIHE
jgi:heme/copper-type cytochrome/quinol oxidase subunit 2